MTEITGIAKIFMHGRSQAVRLPKAFRLEGQEVRVRRAGRSLVLEPIEADFDAWLSRLDAHPEPFMEEGRGQPPMPTPRDVFDE